MTTTADGTTTMMVHVRLFAGLRHLVGDRDIEMALPAGATVGVLREQLIAEYPILEALMTTLVCAVGEEMRLPEHVLRDGDAVDVIPPIAGGAAIAEKAGGWTSQRLHS